MNLEKSRYQALVEELSEYKDQLYNLQQEFNKKVAIIEQKDEEKRTELQWQKKHY